MFRQLRASDLASGTSLFNSHEAMMLSGRAIGHLATRAGRLGLQRTATPETSCGNMCSPMATNSTRRHQSTSSKALEPAKSGQKTPAVTKPDELQEYRPSRPLFYHDQMEWLDERLVRISKPTKNVMQSGTAYTNCWKIEFDSQPRDEYWLMGWTGTKDPMSNSTMTFPTRESAIAFCERNQLHWFLEEQPERKLRRKSYADNFSWNKRTRLGSK